MGSVRFMMVATIGMAALLLSGSGQTYTLYISSVAIGPFIYFPSNGPPTIYRRVTLRPFAEKDSSGDHYIGCEVWGEWRNTEGSGRQRLVRHRVRGWSKEYKGSNAEKNCNKLDEDMVDFLKLKKISKQTASELGL